MSLASEPPESKFVPSPEQNKGKDLEKYGTLVVIGGIILRNNTMITIGLLMMLAGTWQRMNRPIRNY